MRTAISVREATERGDPDALLRALDHYPSIVAATIWARLSDPRTGIPGRYLDRYLLDGLADRGLFPIVFFESYTPYDEVLSRARDDQLKLLGCQLAGRRAVVRIDQEVNGGWGAPWQLPDQRELYIPAFTHMSEVIRSQDPDIRIVYCPVLRPTKRQDEIERFYPGAACQIVALDGYSTTELWTPLAKQWGPTLETYDRIAPGKPKWVCEFARRSNLPERLRWLRSISAVVGVDLVAYFDMDIAWTGDDGVYRDPHPDHSWYMTDQMRTFYATL